MNLHQAGVGLLNALSRHAEIIMQAYIHGSVTSAEISPKVQEKLLQLGILWRPEKEGELRLKSAVRNLLEGSLHENRNRQLDANIGSALAGLKTLAQHYKEALHLGQFNQAQAHLTDLTEHVYALTESLENSVRLLFSRINNEFGYVSSIDAKIRENELAQSQVSELLTQLEMFQFDQLSLEAGSNRELRHLLVVTLQQSFAKVTRELTVVQSRLLALLGRFREFRGRTQLLKGFLLHLEQQPDFRPKNYAQFSQVPKLFNQAKSLLKPASIDVFSVEHEQELQQLVAGIKPAGKKTSLQSERKAQSINLEQQTSVEFEQNRLKLAAEAYFCQVIDSGTSVMALDYMQHQQLDCDPEAWLYQVIGEYQALPIEEQQYFALDYEDKKHPLFDNRIIQDIEIGLR